MGHKGHKGHKIRYIRVKFNEISLLYIFLIASIIVLKSEYIIKILIKTNNS